MAFSLANFVNFNLADNEEILVFAMVNPKPVLSKTGKYISVSAKSAVLGIW